MTIGGGLLPVHQMETLVGPNNPRRDIQQAQAIIYKFLLEIVREWPAADVVREFKNLFIYQIESRNSESLQALYDIVFDNNEIEFRYTLKRSCYILINNWDATRKYKPIQELIQVFNDAKIHEETLSPHLDRLRSWLVNFVSSKDYQELKLFVARYDDSQHWKHRYTSYLLAPQYVDLSNPIEQREAARALSKRLKDKFKFELAMYTAHSQSTLAQNNKHKNPTQLGDEVLRLIKAIVFRRGPFSYANLAHIFIQQIQGSDYKTFKKSFIKYLIFSVSNQDFVKILNTKLSEKLDNTYQDHDEERFNDLILFRTCNRVIEYLLTEDRQEPSSLLALLLNQGHPLTLVIVLLKIIFISPNSRPHLESCIAVVIQYYEKYPEEECQWVINFLELFNIVFAIHAEDVEYNLIRMQEDEAERENSQILLDKYRIFSQLKHDNAPEVSGEISPETPQS